MKAAVITSSDDAPTYRDFAEPPVAEGNQLVDLVGAGIHQIVRSLATGHHYGSAREYPMIPGVDAVARTAEGELIYTGFTTAPYGTLAERISVPGGLPLPADADPVRVAGGMNPGMSSWLPLDARRRELGGDRGLGTVLVVGATGMSGLLAVQNARLLGAERVVGVGRSAIGLARAREFGAAATAALTGDGMADTAAIASALDGEAPTLVLDFLWGAPTEAVFRALGRSGLAEDDADISYVQIGAMAGPDAALPGALLRSRHLRVHGSGAGSQPLAEVMAQLPVYMGHLASGAVTAPVRALPLSRIGEAWEAAGRGGDRIVVVPD